MENIEIIRNQRDILFNACKSIATNRKCPDWVSKVLTTAVMNAKQLQKNVKNENIAELSKNLELNAVVKSNKENDNCIYKIVKIGPIVQEVQLYDLVIIKGNKDNPEGTIIHNVPSNWLLTAN